MLGDTVVLKHHSSVARLEVRSYKQEMADLEHLIITKCFRIKVERNSLAPLYS